MESEQFFNDFLNKHKYYVDVVKKVDNGIIGLAISYEDKEYEAYTILFADDNEFAVVQYYPYIAENENNKYDIYEMFYLPTFLVRHYIFLHIMKKTVEKSLPYEIVRFINEENKQVKNLNQLLPDPLLNKDKKKEIEIDEILAGVVLNKKISIELDQKLKEKGLYHAFYLLKGLLI